MVNLLPEDVLVLYTDGYVEATDQDGELFGERRFRKAIRKYRHFPTKEMARKIEASIRQFEEGAGAPGDDRTPVIIKS